MGPATKIYSLLIEVVDIDYDRWTMNWDTTLELLTWGQTKLYDDEKVLEDCSVDDVVILLTFEPIHDSTDEEKHDDGIIEGVFSRFSKRKAFKSEYQMLSEINEWRTKLMEWVRRERVDGRKMKMEILESLAEQMRVAMNSESVDNLKSLGSSCITILKLCRLSPVHRILEMFIEWQATRLRQIQNNLKNAMECGCIAAIPSLPFQPDDVTFQPDEDVHLLALDDNEPITVSDVEIFNAVENVESFQTLLDIYCEAELSFDVRRILLSVLRSINDSGLILAKTHSIKLLEFLFDHFRAAFPRSHSNFKEWVLMYQVFLDLICFRRKRRVMLYIDKNISRFDAKLKAEIEAMRQTVSISLDAMQNEMTLCRRKCTECFYPCLLQIHHDDQDHVERHEEHTCRQSMHNCKEPCKYCDEEQNLDEKGNTIRCALESGHQGNHKCLQNTHYCKKECQLKDKPGCQLECAHQIEHEGDCCCAAEKHFCPEVCEVSICKRHCHSEWNKEHGEHLCAMRGCPYKCEVLCWNESIQQVVPCGRPCSCEDHAHALRMESGECKDEGHTCDEPHRCPKRCTEEGVCHVEIKRKFVENKIFTTGAGSKIEYEAYAEANAERLRCVIPIPVGKFEHDGDDHRCYRGDNKPVHTCLEKCDDCGYYCEMPFGHHERDGSLHDCVHGNKRNTKFYATKNTIDTGDNREYAVGDSGVAEMCNEFCKRRGRGHIHLVKCYYAENGRKCVEENGRKHQSKKYMPDPKTEKDEVTHSKFWSMRRWKDPCRLDLKRQFDKCNFSMSLSSMAIYGLILTKL